MDFVFIFFVIGLFGLVLFIQWVEDRARERGRLQERHEEKLRREWEEV